MYGKVCMFVNTNVSLQICGESMTTQFIVYQVIFANKLLL